MIFYKYFYSSFTLCLGMYTKANEWENLAYFCFPGFPVCIAKPFEIRARRKVEDFGAKVSINLYLN